MPHAHRRFDGERVEADVLFYGKPLAGQGSQTRVDYVAEVVEHAYRDVCPSLTVARKSALTL